MTARTANIIEFLFNKNISLFSKTRNLGERIIADYKHNTWQENDSKKFLRYALSSPFAQPKTKMKRSVSFVIKRCVLNPYLSFILGEKFSVRNIFLDRESKGKSKTTNYLQICIVIAKFRLIASVASFIRFLCLRAEFKLESCTHFLRNELKSLRQLHSIGSKPLSPESTAIFFLLYFAQCVTSLPILKFKLTCLRRKGLEENIETVGFIYYGEFSIVV